MSNEELRIAIKSMAGDIDDRGVLEFVYSILEVSKEQKRVDE